MHRVINYGSILQAYALQKKVNQLGYDSEIIDYLYPPKKKISYWKQAIMYLYRLGVDIFFGGVLRRKKKRFDSFYKNNLVVSPKIYSKQIITEEPPVYDIYMSGSDQVWNPNYIKDDTSFLLSFVPKGKKRVSYASSFAINEIPQEYSLLYKKELNKYHTISVRENTGINIVRKLTGCDAQVVCDPTLLLTRKEWDELANQSELKIKEKYILVYVLSYMFNPYPEIYNIVDNVQKELGNIKVIYLTGKKEDMFRPNSRLIKDAGPNEFVYLFKNATFVITTSFHGTAFSLIYGKPVYGVVKSELTKDGRIPSLLSKVQCEKSIISYKSDIISNCDELLSQKCSESLLQQFREESESLLSNMLK